MIPKKIHYCWFGHGEMTPLMKKCIKSWRKHCPDYEIIEWNEDNFDLESSAFAKQAYENKKWAFVSDYVRLYVLYNIGGIYLDTDIKLIKSLDPFLQHTAFSGFETPNQLQTGIIASEKQHPAIKEWLDYYNGREYFINGVPDKEPNVKYLTDIFLKHGLVLNDTYQEICGMAIYPQTYFCPLCITSTEKKFSRNTVAIHYFTSTWRKPSEIETFKRVRWHRSKRYRFLIWLRFLPNRIVRRIFGDQRIDKLKEKIHYNNETK